MRLSRKQRVHKKSCAVSETSKKFQRRATLNDGKNHPAPPPPLAAELFIHRGKKCGKAACDVTASSGHARSLATLSAVISGSPWIDKVRDGFV